MNVEFVSHPTVGSRDDEEIIDRAAQVGVSMVTAQPYYLEKKPKGEFLFGYAQLTSAQIQEGIRKLAQVVAENSSG
jgi:GntR family transcriptional regulator/MocR family aminotransferase